MSTWSPNGGKKRRELPPLFCYMEMGDWDKATDRVRRHPREIKLWATLRTKSSTNDTSSTKRLALHHAIFKLRSAGSVPAPTRGEDPFVTVCRFILMLVRLYPEAASQRESRHGCLPLHLAAFASCAPRSDLDHDPPPSAAAAPRAPPPLPSPATVAGQRSASTASTSGGALSKPGVIQRRVASDATTNTMDTAQTNMSAIHAEETYTGGMGDKEIRKTQQLENPHVSVAMRESSTINPKREEMAVAVVNALLDAYPKAIRVDSEGGRMPLHTACAGRATPRIVSTLVTAYPAAARHRNKDGFLPLHLAAHWGVSHPNVAITLLKAYPDATVGRNRWERTPLEEALTMAGENGRPHQQALVRALRKHPNYWANPPPEVLFGRRLQAVAPVDMDDSLPSNDTSTEEEKRYLQYGHHAMVDPEGIVEGEGKEMPLQPKQMLQQDLKAHRRSPTTQGSPGRGGFLSRLSPKRASSEPTAKKDVEDFTLGFGLETLIQNRKWPFVAKRIAHNPLEAEQNLTVMTRGGFTAASGFTPLHYACERQPPLDVVEALIENNPTAVVTRCLPGGSLPLHIACTWYGSAEVVGALLAADQTTVRTIDELGNIALHSACFSGADEQVIERLLAADANSVLTRNKQGSRPIDICKRLRHDNRRAVMAILTLKKEELMSKHKRSQSSGTWSEVASEAVEMHESSVWGSRGDPGFRETDDLQESAMGVEVSYNEEENQELLWI